MNLFKTIGYRAKSKSWKYRYLQTYQLLGFLISVPGIGLVKRLFSSAHGLMTLIKSACLRSCPDVFRFGAPGVINPITFLCCSLTICKVLAKSESFETITAQSYASAHASLRTCNAKLTSEPFSSVLKISTLLGGGLAFSADTLCRKKWPKYVSTSGQQTPSALRYVSCLILICGSRSVDWTRAVKNLTLRSLFSFPNIVLNSEVKFSHL